MSSPPRFFQDSEADYAKRLVAWLIDKGYICVDFTDPRLRYFTAQIDADLLPVQRDGPEVDGDDAWRSVDDDYPYGTQPELNDGPEVKHTCRPGVIGSAFACPACGLHNDGQADG